MKQTLGYFVLVILTATDSADDRFDDLDTYLGEAMPKWRVEMKATTTVHRAVSRLAREVRDR